ncbi:MAG: hypothetical protein VW577_05125 [Pelagibacteraceae bacterium]
MTQTTNNEHSGALDCSTSFVEPAWLTRLAHGNGTMSEFVAKEIATEVRELLLYKRAMDSMASQLICPKRTGLQMAKMQLGIKD